MRLLGIVCAAVLAVWAPGASAGTLWEIGVADNSCAEFALAPNGYANFAEDGCYVVGFSEPGRDWPYVHPGPADAWAGGRNHAFVVVFGAAGIPASGECVLRLDLVDSHGGGPPKLAVGVNGSPFEYSVPAGSGIGSITGDPSKGIEHIVQVTFPVSLLKEGGNEISVASTAGSWMLYDWVGLETPDGVQLVTKGIAMSHIGQPTCLPVLIRDGDVLRQVVRVPLRYLGEPVDATLRVGAAEPVAFKLDSATQACEARIPAVETDTPVTVSIEAGDKVLAQSELVLEPVRPWTIYMMHHTHLDIGYTHVQTEVEQIQWRHLEQAMELAKATAGNPEGSRFVWLPEGLWAVDSYLRNATPEKKQAFVDAVKAGAIGLDALYGNELTALCRPEELIELTGCARRLEREFGFAIDSAMISDVPGYTWGMIPVLAQSGVKYFSIGPNGNHRIGYTLSQWGDKPFYWVSPSGKERVLCWVHAKAYSWFHHSVNREQIHAGSEGKALIDYLAELEGANYPYDIAMVRYNIGGDNGPPDPRLPEFVKDWNERYASPKIVIATVGEAFGAFERQYGANVPEVRGDFTPYWEDGAGSSSLETGQNRAAAERLVQAQTLFAMNGPAAYPPAAFQAAWREAILYDEHTWGAHNSISDPECAFALGQWAIKQAFAVEAEKQSQVLLDQAARMQAPDEVAAVLVYNTSTWPRTDVVLLPAAWKLAGGRVLGPDGQPVPSQRLKTGELAFLADNVPATGAARFTIDAGEPLRAGDAQADGLAVMNGMVSAILDETTGAIANLQLNGVYHDFVDGSSAMGLNDYFYVAGRSPKHPERNGQARISVKERGPLVASLLVESDAPGCRALTREVRVYAGLDRVDILNVIDKENVYTPEAVHLAFPFRVRNGEVRMDIPFAVASVEKDQVPGSCKNYFTVQRWADVSNDTLGVTWATLDAPLVEVGAITCDARTIGWIKSLPPSQTLYSYAMNNYWETNYKAGQQGPTPFRYSLRPHKKYDQAEAQRFGVERSQPLIAVPAQADTPVPGSLLSVAPEAVMVTALKPADDGDGLVVRLFNGSAEPCTAALTWSAVQLKQVLHSNLFEDKGDPVNGTIGLAPYETVTLRAEIGG
ncbi:MAG: alpha-mannosidase [Candidatus Hydrogenedentes bacterium]|nr:alpha-mannosidase [Candidatus Hydrogenedentota bacterium]